MKIGRRLSQRREMSCVIGLSHLMAPSQDVALEIGLHTGECDVVGGKYGGVALELARHLRSVSTDGNIIVSRTVKASLPVRV